MAKKRFFIYRSREDQERDDRDRTYYATCSVLDRETIEDGKYKVMKSGLKYLDASGVAAALNGSPNQFSPKEAL